MKTVLRFGPFDLDAQAGELRKNGEVVALQPQPLKILVLLVRRRGELVTREEIRKEIWSDATFVDFNQGLNFCVRQIREALGDDAGAPRYVETLPRRGYRFMMAGEDQGSGAAGGRLTRMIVLPFRMLRDDPDSAFLAVSLPDAITHSLSGLNSLVMRSSLAASRFGGQTDLRAIAAEAEVDVVLTGSIVRSGRQLRVMTQLSEVPAGTLLWSRTWDVSFSDLFQVQDELAAGIVESLALPLTAREHGLLKRDIPGSARAYEWYLRANQLSLDPSQWRAAREVYLRCVAEDPEYAPAWARLGRIHHVLAKFTADGGSDDIDHADAAFRRALEINPDLPIGHLLYAQLEADLGRSLDAMTRLLGRATGADPEAFAGLVTACRYCGMLDASVAADARARWLDPRIRTSVAHTWFQRGDFAQAASAPIAQNPYIVGLSLAATGRHDEAVAALGQVEATASGTLLRDAAIAARTLLEQKAEESIAAISRIVALPFRDPEALYYLARHLAHLKRPDAALELLDRVVDTGYCCFPVMDHDPWLAGLRRRAEFRRLREICKARHSEAVSMFAQLRGHLLLGLAPPVGRRGPRRRH